MAELQPLLALPGNALADIVSTRVLDPRARNIAATTMVPLLGLLVVQLACASRSGPGSTWRLRWADVALIRLAVRLFDREELLTGWR